MKIAIIGNSHVAAIKNAWLEIPKNISSEFEFTFFAPSNGTMAAANLDISGNTLVPSNKELEDRLIFTSGGLETINCDTYDAFLICGLSLGVSHAVESTYSIYSSSVQMASLKDFWEGTELYDLLTKLRDCTGKPIFVLHNPLIGANKDNENTDAIYNRFIADSNEVFFKLFDSKLLPQAPETIVNGFNTKIEFTQNARMFLQNQSGSGKLFPRKNKVHMNADFGSLVLRKFLELQCSDM